MAHMARTALSLVSALMVSGTVLAAEVDPAWEAAFNKADLNDSGGLSLVELGKVSGDAFAFMKKNFKAMDTNKDGQVTLAEQQAYLAKHPTTTKAAAKSTPVVKDQCQPDCGVVTATDRYKIEGEGGVLGAVAGGVAGGLLGNQVGKGTGKTVATVGGAAAGGYAGYQVEKKLKTKKMVKVTVKLDNGQMQNFDFEADKSPYAVGARVQVVDGQLTAYSGK